MSVTGEVLRTMRPRQWTKNLFVVAPLVFAEEATDARLLGSAAAAFILFSSLSGCVYFLNDIVDIKSDREHPTKRHRPIPSGRLPLQTARVTLVLLLTLTLAASVWLSPSFAAVGASYFALNVLYSFVLKHVPYVDITIIASGFLLRILGGALAVAVPLSAWLGACTLLLASFLGLGKRKHELLMVDGRGAKQRRVLSRYNVDHVQIAMHILAFCTAATYFAYTLVGANEVVFDPQDLMPTLPFVCFGLWRFSALTARVHQGKSPTDLMLHDTPFIANLVLWFLTVIAIVYLL